MAEQKKDRLQNFVYSGENNMKSLYLCPSCGKKFALKMGNVVMHKCPFCKTPIAEESDQE